MRFFTAAPSSTVDPTAATLLANFARIGRSPRPRRFPLLSPQELIDIALAEQVNGNIGIAFTYNEPFITFEYVL
jgi:pyruvate-formate lyase-activating enzyme